MDNFMKKLAASQAFEPDDALSEIIAQCTADELDEESLDFVYAATKVSYNDFLRKKDRKNTDR